MTKAHPRKEEAIKLNLENVGFYLLLFFCVFIPFRSPLADFTTEYIKLLPDILILAIFIWYSIDIRFRYKFKLYDMAYFVFLIWALISTVFVNNMGIYKYFFEVRSLSIYYLMFFVLRNFKYGRNEFLTVVKVLNYIAVALFMLAIVEKVGNKELLYPRHVAESITYPSNFTRVYGMFYNPNTYGAFLAFVFIFNIHISIFLKEKRHLLEEILIYTSLVTSLLLTQSRSSYIMLLLALILLCAIAIKNKLIKLDKFKLRRYAFRVAAVILCSTLLYGGTINAGRLYFQNVIADDGKNHTDKKPDKPPAKTDGFYESANKQTASDRVTETFEDKIVNDSKTDGRIFSLTKALKIAKDYPVFGTGFGSFGSAASLGTMPDTYKEYGIWKGFYADNQFAAVVTETGFVGLLFFCIFLLIGLISFWKSPLKLTLCIMMAGLGVFYNVFEVQIIAMLLWMTVAFDDKHLAYSKK